jgi:predicted ThiF/HesA family dinucleotide-utilizing enzyme
MTGPPTLTDLMADLGELDVTCLDCHHNTTIPVTTLLPRYAAERGTVTKAA